MFAGTFLGCLPNNFVAVSAGSKLGELQSLQDLYDRKLLLLGTSAAKKRMAVAQVIACVHVLSSRCYHPESQSCPCA